MRTNKLILVLLLIASLFTYQIDNQAGAQTTEPSPEATASTDDGRPPDAWASPEMTSETCNCTCPAPDTFTYQCQVYRPDDTRTCSQACADEQPMHCTGAQSASSPEGM